MKDKDTPLRLVRLWPKMYPDCYETLDDLKTLKPVEMNWPDYCELPIGAAFEYLRTKLNDYDAATLCAELTACWTWRNRKIMYSFDGDLATLLAAQDMEDADVLPMELLLHLPYPCIYIKCPNLVGAFDGFFAWVEYDLNRNAPELRIQWVSNNMDTSVARFLHLVPGTIKACVLDTCKTVQKNIRAPLDVTSACVTAIKDVVMAIQLLLYILSDNADVVERPMLKSQYTGANVVSIKKEDKAGNIGAYDVGIRIGAALRKRYTSLNPSGEPGSKKRPHSRRGHWHHYWTGSGSERKLILKWTAPTFVNADIDIEDNVVVVPIKKEQNND